MLRSRCAIFMAAMLGSLGPAQAQSGFDKIYGFGDSYTDTNAPGQPGGIYQAVGLAALIGPIPPFPASTPEGRFSSGGNYVDRLQQNFAIGESVNYAFGGATTNQFNVVNFRPPAGGGALLPFPSVPPADPNGIRLNEAGMAREIELVENGGTILNSATLTPNTISPLTFDPKDMVALSMVGNNANSILWWKLPTPGLALDDASQEAAGRVNPANALTYAAKSAAEMGDAAQKLVDRGARTITFFGPGGAGLFPVTPLGLSLPAENIDGAAEFAGAFRPAVEAEFAKIAAQGVRVNFFDYAELQRRVLVGGEAARFGFTKVTGVPNMAADLVAAVPCNPVPGGNNCNPAGATGYFYWDAVHLTEEAYNLAADFMTIQLVQNETIPVAADLADIQARNFTETLSRRMEARRYGGSVEEGYPSADSDPKRLSWKDEPAPLRDDRFAMFVAGGFGSGQRDDRPGEVGFDYDLANIVAGAEWKPYEHALIGAAIGYTRANADYAFLRGHGETDLDSVNIGAYASLSYPNFFADLTLAYSANDYELSRTGIVSPFGVGIGLDSSADTDGHSFVADFRTGYLFRSGALGIGPVGGLLYSHVTVDGYTESGDSLLTMNVEKQALESLTGSIGVQLRYRGDGIEPYVAVTLEKEFMGDRSYEFALTSASSVVNSVDVGEESDPFGRVRTGLKANLSDGLTGSLDGNATFGREFGDDYAISGSLTYRF